MYPIDQTPYGPSDKQWRGGHEPRGIEGREGITSPKWAGLEQLISFNETKRQQIHKLFAHRSIKYWSHLSVDVVLLLVNI